MWVIAFESVIFSLIALLRWRDILRGVLDCLYLLGMVISLGSDDLRLSLLARGFLELLGSWVWLGKRLEQ